MSKSVCVCLVPFSLADSAPCWFGSYVFWLICLLPISIFLLWCRHHQIREELTPLIADTIDFTNNAFDAGRKILVEGVYGSIYFLNIAPMPSHLIWSNLFSVVLFWSTQVPMPLCWTLILVPILMWPHQTLPLAQSVLALALHLISLVISSGQSSRWVHRLWTDREDDEHRIGYWCFACLFSTVPVWVKDLSLPNCWMPKEMNCGKLEERGQGCCMDGSFFAAPYLPYPFSDPFIHTCVPCCMTNHTVTWGLSTVPPRAVPVVVVG